MDNPFSRYQNLLRTYIKPQTIPILYKLWTDRSRVYHNINHLNEVLQYIQRYAYKFNQDEFEQLVLAAFFHDAIYDMKDPKGNEDKSIKLFRDSYIGQDKKFELVDKAIECTKYRKRPTNFLLRIFWDADNEGFREPWIVFLKNEHKIRHEFSHIPEDIYKKARIEFLESNLGLFGPNGDGNVRKLIKYIRDK